ncbi:Protein CsiD [Salmonella enterica subsp. enterica]|uniref:Protein CsiD n=1 Tax=Salmonella enterica I TaxID=59201 RepID=A0A379VLX1_SALET|nr:Protein CsiD [Salmonella enterica subsp. enterica]
MVKLATAVAHLIGRSNYDAMSGQYYARFVVKNVDNSDSYLRQPHRVMELHNDGTYVEGGDRLRADDENRRTKYGRR